MALILFLAVVVVLSVSGFFYVLCTRNRRSNPTDQIMFFVFSGFVFTVFLTMSIIFYIKSDFIDIYDMGIEEHVELFEEVEVSGDVDDTVLLSALVFDALYGTDMYDVLASLDVDDSYLNRKRFVEELGNVKDIENREFKFISKRDSLFRKLTNIYSSGVANLIRDDSVIVSEIEKEYEILAGKGHDFVIDLDGKRVYYRYMGEYDGELNFYIGKDRNKLFAVKTNDEGTLVARNVKGDSMYEIRVVKLYDDGSVRLDVKQYGLKEVKYERYDDLIEKYK